MPAEHRVIGAPARLWAIASHALVALLAYVPLLATRPGVVSADTKSYLYIDPAKLMSRAVSMWDPNVGMGTLTHQTIGYLFPMGPWYWAFDHLGVPDWTAQRLWLGTVLFAAGAGVLYLTRTLGWRGAAPVAAALVYMLTPYVCDYSARISVILLPWAALPWLVAFTDRSLRRGGWRDPAAFALVVLAVGGVNATALVFAGLGPVLWIPFAVAHGDTTWRRAAGVTLRIGVLTAAVSLWWVIGLAVQGKYGIPILQYTETVQAVSRTSLASEVMRGLGYWFFYGNDKLGAWIQPAVAYTQRPGLLVTSFAVPVLALAAAAALRWRHRAYAITLVVAGAVIAVGAHPYDHPAPLGGLFKSFATSSTAGLALRSTARAIPLVALGVALLLGAAVTAIERAARARPAGLAAAGLVGVLAVVNLPPLFTGDLAVGKGISRPEHLPSYWYDAAHYLDSRGRDTRVLELPGSDFAAYRWGNTIDPITPFLMERPYVARELIPYGTAGSADLLNALDRRLQEGVFEPLSLAPIARLMGVGDVVLRNDLEYERYRTPRPKALWQELTPPPPGLGAPVGFGPGRPNLPRPSLPLQDEIALGLPASAPDPPEVAAFPVGAAVPIVRTAAGGGETIVAGDGEGLVDLAAAGLLDPTRLTRYAATLDKEPGAWAAVVASDARLVLTDTNRLRARRWGTVRENTGYTEQPGSGPLVDDPADARLDVFPGETTGAETVAQLRGVSSVRASAYGNPVTYTPEDRPANALDGDPSTAWRVGAFAPVKGQVLRIDLASPVTAGSVRLVQPLTGSRNRWLTRVRLRFDGRSSLDVDLDGSSRTAAGQTVTFPARRFRRLEIEVLGDSAGRRARYDGLSGVGLAEVGVGDVRVDEVLRLPTDLLGGLGARSNEHALDIVMTRQRANPAEPVRADEEPVIRRTFSLPAGRTFTVGGTLRVAADAPDELIDALAGLPGLDRGAPVARSDGRLNGDLRARASAAIDGDPSTAWMPGFLDQAGHWLEVEAPAATSVDHLDLSVLADGRHSVPSRVRLDVDGRPVGSFDLPAVQDQATPGATASVPVRFPAVRGRTFRLTIEAVAPRTTVDYYSGQPVQMPVGIAELGLPGIRSPTSAGAGLSRECRTVGSIDGAPLRARPEGSVDDLLAGRGVSLVPCDPPVSLGPGDHDVRGVPGRGTGLALDRLVLSSAAGGGPAPAVGASAGGGAGGGHPPTIRVTGSTRTSYRLTISGASGPFWLVLGQSLDRGWVAKASGRDLGPARLVDGYANGWRVDPRGSSFTMTLTWTPQRTVWAGLALSALATLACLAVVAGSLAAGWRHRRQTTTVSSPRGDPGARAPRASITTTVSSPRGDPGARAPRASITTTAERDDDPPALADPADGGGLRPLAAVGAGIGAFLAGGPVVGLVVLALALAASAGRWGRRVLVFAAPGALAVAGGYVVLQQVRYGYPPDFAWPTNAAAAHVIAGIALGSLAAGALVHPRSRPAHRVTHGRFDRLRRRAPAPPTAPPPA